jgi:hypothetical protein
MMCFDVVFILLLLSISCVETHQQQQGNLIHTTARLSQARDWLAATSSGELVFFGGGENATGKVSARVDILNVSSGKKKRMFQVEIGQQPLSLNLVLFLQPHPHEILSFLVEVGMEQQIQIELIFTTFQVEVGALQLSLNLVVLLQPHQLEILFYLVEVTVLIFLQRWLMCTM